MLFCCPPPIAYKEGVIESGCAIVRNGEKIIHQIVEVGQNTEIYIGIPAVGEQIHIIGQPEFTISPESPMIRREEAGFPNSTPRAEALRIPQAPPPLLWLRIIALCSCINQGNACHLCLQGVDRKRKALRIIRADRVSADIKLRDTSRNVFEGVSISGPDTGHPFCKICSNQVKTGCKI